MDGHVERQFMFERPPGFKQKIAGALSQPLRPPGTRGRRRGQALSGGRSEFMLPRSTLCCVEAPGPSPRGVPVLVPVRASPVPSVVPRGTRELFVKGFWVPTQPEIRMQKSRRKLRGAAPASQGDRSACPEHSQSTGKRKKLGVNKHSECPCSRLQLLAFAAACALPALCTVAPRISLLFVDPPRAFPPDGVFLPQHDERLSC